MKKTRPADFENRLMHLGWNSATFGGDRNYIGCCGYLANYKEVALLLDKH